ncbi:hypothetical protein PHLCEN_2v137 [Hermanssonia centrifuga]|uniref:Uncharacterized protein n=1 Tax=Hermanssonia centrifuga TaxID=98765 RepID=A0A2R6S725_9APHY|nr:hypothetical protein PHLCEN_2v137 [Hermanssonia centrifuga]
MISEAPTKGILVTFHGPSYPDPFTNEETPQSFNIRVFCDTDASDPTFKSYDGKDTWVEWTHNAGCALGINPGQPPKTNPDPENDGDDIPESSVGSGIGYFFLLYVSILYRKYKMQP